jgi:hypothetical protein
MAAIVGRDDELRAIEEFFAGAPASPTALVLEGEPGIGKSTLWRRGVELAEEHGICTLTARPAEAERTHAHAALGDLFEDVLEDVALDLPPPRRHALRVALLLEAPEDAALPRAVGVATRSALELLAQRDPLAIAIDDEQWLDASSATALVFALRRLAAPVRLLLSRRVGATGPIEDALPEDAVQVVSVGALSLGAIHQLVHERLGASFSRVTLRRLHETAGGNPFYALELARALKTRGTIDPTQPLPVPERLEELVDARLERLTGRTREALVLVSAHPRLTPSQLDAAGVDRDALEPALREHVLELAEGGVRFVHPLLASALYQSLAGAERKRAHAVLAELIDDTVDRARHLALATDTPDADIAATLERAAAAANTRGAPIVAAELGEHALRLTPPEAHADADRRLGAAARAHRDAGEAERSRALADELLARAPSGPQRAEALVLMAGSSTRTSPAAICCRAKRWPRPQPGRPYRARSSGSSAGRSASPRVTQQRKSMRGPLSSSRKDSKTMRLPRLPWGRSQPCASTAENRMRLGSPSRHTSSHGRTSILALGSKRISASFTSWSGPATMNERVACSRACRKSGVSAPST